MARFKYEYVERKSKSIKPNRSKVTWRDWQLVKCSSGNLGIVSIKSISFPQGCVGKRIRLKVEFMGEGGKND